MPSLNSPPAFRSTYQKFFMLAAIVSILVLFFGLGFHRQLTLEALQQAHAALQHQRAASPWSMAALFLVAYILITALSLPGAAVGSLAGGAIFGLGLGTILVSFASSIGALLAFLVARTLLRDLVLSRFSRQLAPIQEGFARDGVLYLLSLRLVPVFPFFLVNLLMALTSMRAFSFYIISQIGMLPGTLVYVNAGTQLALLKSLDDILSPPLLGSLLLLAAFPWLGRSISKWWQQRCLYRSWPRPRRFDRNIIVIGAGAAGLVSSYIAAMVKAEITMVEKGEMGGDCLNTGCVPSKALISSARLAARMRRADRYGLEAVDPQVRIRDVMSRVLSKVEAIAPHDSVERYRALGVEVLRGEARLLDPWTVAIREPGGGAERRLTARSVVLATGAEPIVPSIPGADRVPLLTSETIWSWLASCTLDQPKIAVLGGGPIACELAQALAQLGLPITLIHRGERILSKEDPDVAGLVLQALKADGVILMMSTTVLALHRRPGSDDSIVVELDMNSQQQTISCDAVLCAYGRQPRVTGYGLEQLGISKGGAIPTNQFLQTLYPNIYAVGDVLGSFQYTHVAAHQAWYAVVNALFGHFRSFKVDYRVIPRTTFTDPEVATVGYTESQAHHLGLAVEVTRFSLHELDRAIVDGEEDGFVKVLTACGSDRIVGATIVGQHAGELLIEFVSAMKWGLGLGKIFATIHAYPTMAEANKYAASSWKKQRLPTRLMPWLRRYHAWRRRS